MKKTIMFLGVLSLGLAQAQQNAPYEGKVGVNTETPSATLNVKSKTGKTGATKNFELENANGTKMVTVLDNGRMGVGTETPEDRIHAIGTIRTSHNSSEGGSVVLENLKKSDENLIKRWQIFNMAENANYSQYSNGLHFWAYTVGGKNLGPRMVLSDEGNLGVNIKAPLERLHIAGGKVRINDLPTTAGTSTDKMVVVDNDGVLKSIGVNDFSATQEWVYDSNTKRINLRRSGQGDFKNQVYYNDKGGLYTADTQSFKIFKPTNNETINADITTQISGHNKQVINSKNIAHLAGSSYRILNNSTFIANKENANQSFVNNSINTMIEADDAANYTLLTGLSSVTNHYGTGNVVDMYGAQARGHIANSGNVTGIASGFRSEFSVSGAGSNINKASAISPRIYTGSTTTIQQFSLIDGFAELQENSQANITDLAGYRFFMEYKGNNTIENSIGFLYGGHQTLSGTTTIKNNYGILLNSVEGGTEKNFAIYANAGQVRFGDLKGKGNRNVYADTDGVLKVGDAGATQLSGTDGIVCNEENRGKMNFKKGDAGKSDVFGICMKNSDGNYYWGYMIGGNNPTNGTGAFGNGL